MRDRRALLAALGLTVALALSGCAAGAARPAASTPAPSASSTRVPIDTGLASAPQDPVLGDAAPTSTAVPVRVRIPAIHVDAPLIRLHRDASGILQAPPSDRLDEAGWYADGTVPGQVGPAVIAGHVDWVHQVAVFHRLGELKAGDEVRVRMSDGSTVRFRVDGTRSVSKFHFPTAAVYGPTPDAQLRLITCGGPWDDARNIYSENVIVSATRTS